MNLLHLKNTEYSFEAVIYVKAKNEKRKGIAVIKSPECELYGSNKTPIDKAMQVNLYLGSGGNHILFFDDHLIIIDDTFYVEETAEEPFFKKLLLEYLQQGTISLQEFLPRIIFAYCTFNQAQVLVSKPTWEPVIPAAFHSRQKNKLLTQSRWAGTRAL